MSIDKDKVAWLIKKPGPLYLYYGSHGSHGAFAWTTNVNEALRLAREQDAECIAATLLVNCYVVEHMWMADIPEPTPPPNRRICEACGEIPDGKHTNWICRFLVWLNNRSKQ